jgi:hypothetical protein
MSDKEETETQDLITTISGNQLIRVAVAVEEINEDAQAIAKLDLKPTFDRIKKNKAIIKDAVISYNGKLPRRFHLGPLPVYWKNGSRYIDRNLLLLEGVSVDTIDKCTRTRPGSYAIGTPGADEDE